jgi:hypothetical protein
LLFKGRFSLLLLLGVIGIAASPKTNVRSSEPEEGESSINQLVVTDSTPWKEEMGKIHLEARFVTGKDLAVLDSLFSRQVRAVDNSNAEQAIYLVVRLSMTARLGPFCSKLTVRALPEDDWPFALPDPITFGPLGTKTGVVYYCEHVLGAAEGHSDGYRETLVAKKWRFEVVEASFK